MTSTRPGLCRRERGGGGGGYIGGKATGGGVSNHPIGVANVSREGKSEEERLENDCIALHRVASVDDVCVLDKVEHSFVCFLRRLRRAANGSCARRDGCLEEVIQEGLSSMLYSLLLWDSLLNENQTVFYSSAGGGGGSRVVTTQYCYGIFEAGGYSAPKAETFVSRMPCFSRGWRVRTSRVARTHGGPDCSESDRDVVKSHPKGGAAGVVAAVTDRVLLRRPLLIFVFLAILSCFFFVRVDAQNCTYYCLRTGAHG